MPELPEVEVVRRGLDRFVVGRTIAEVKVLHPRAIRRHVLGLDDFAAQLTGKRIIAACRRGKYLWLELDGGALLAHLGMSGQMLIRPQETEHEAHLRIKFSFTDNGPQLRFVDQRTFGGFLLTDLITVDGSVLPAVIAHIARDPLDPKFAVDKAIAALRRRRTEVKRALLDQNLVSGIGNIYADEALWRSKLHWTRPTATLSRAEGQRLFDEAAKVMTEALDAGGTSFDSLYVNVNGQSGYFDRSLAVYGQRDRPCPRCGTLIQREAFMNRSAYFCPQCQPCSAP